MAQPPPPASAAQLLAQVLPAPQLDQLRRTLRLDALSTAELALRICRAALLDYTALFFDTGLLTRADEINQRRCLLLMEHVFQSVPPDSVLAAALRIKPGQARTLINAISARFPERIHGLLVGDARACLASVNLKDTSDQEIFIWSDATLQFIREQIDQLNYEQTLLPQPAYYSSIRWKEGFRKRFSISPVTAGAVLQSLHGP